VGSGDVVLDTSTVNLDHGNRSLKSLQFPLCIQGRRIGDMHALPT